MADHKNLIEAFIARAEKTPNKRFMTQPVNGAKDEVLYWTYGEALSEAKKMANYIDSLELDAGSRIALCSKNCSWWIMADLAIWMSGHVTVPVYPTLTGETVAYILEHSESQLLFIGKLDEKPWAEMKKGVPDSMLTVNFPMSPGGAKETWKDLVGKFGPIEKVADRSPEEMATIIYTSGSTGMPKGVMQSFSTLLATTKGISNILKMNDNDRYLSYLPLAHGMERWLAECVALYTGMELFFAEALTTFVQDLNRAKPTLFMSVPRLWTKFQQGVFKKMPPQKLDLLLKIPLINTIVRKKIVKTLGLDSCRLAGSGSAPMPAELIGWYRKLGIELLEGYGLTETFNYCHLSRPGKARVGYVGNPYPDVDVRIADDGEIQLKTPGQMMGYYKNEEATKETMTADGYFRTGDRGEVDSEGRLKITGRTKEIFKTSKGKYVAPAPIESALINHPRVELACVGGSSYPQPHAVLQLSEDAKESGDRAEIEKELEAHIKVVNAKVDPHEHLEFVAIVKDEWLPENGFLTPTQKIVRRKIEEAYAPNNDTWYGSKKKVIWHGW